MDARSKESLTQQVIVWLLLGTLAALALWLAYTALSDAWLWIIIWANS